MAKVKWIMDFSSGWFYILWCSGMENSCQAADPVVETCRCLSAACTVKNHLPCFDKSTFPF